MRKFGAKPLAAKNLLYDPTSGAIMKLNQEASYRSGRALAGHMATAHAGKFDENCQACRELKLKSQVP